MLSSTLLFLNIGTPEMMLILFVALLLFGGKKLPELARGLGKGIREFKDASEDVKREIHNQINSFEEKLNEEPVEENPSPYHHTPEETQTTDAAESEKEEEDAPYDGNPYSKFKDEHALVPAQSVPTGADGVVEEPELATKNNEENINH